MVRARSLERTRAVRCLLRHRRASPLLTLPPHTHPSHAPAYPHTQVTVKWGKQSHDVEVDPAAPPAIFKGQLFALTGVPPDRQKIMVRSCCCFPSPGVGADGTARLPGLLDRI